jgi:hypothetical protein
LELSSEGSSGYSGPLGNSWSLKLGSKKSAWMKPNRNVTAKSSKSGNTINVEIAIKNGQSVTGAVGTLYRLIDLYSETPTLEKYSMGGISGFEKIATYQCLSGND